MEIYSYLSVYAYEPAHDKAYNNKTFVTSKE